MHRCPNTSGRSTWLKTQCFNTGHKVNYMSIWDISLIGAVSLLGTAMAYVHDPERKAFMLVLPGKD